MNTLRHRIDSGWEVSRALCTPLVRRGANKGSKEEVKARRARNTLAGRVLDLEARLDILSSELERLTGLLGASAGTSEPEDQEEKEESGERIFF